MVVTEYMHKKEKPSTAQSLTEKKGRQKISEFTRIGEKGRKEEEAKSVWRCEGEACAKELWSRPKITAAGAQTEPEK